MTAAIIELNDHEIRVAKGDRIVARSPAAALIRGNDVVVGEPARVEAFIHPREFHDRFWVQLNQQKLRRPARSVRHHADLAFRHMQQIANDADGIGEAVLAVPGGYDKEQLALLLGIAQACDIRVVALVDTAVAAAAACAGPGRFQHVEIEQHRAVVTQLAVGEEVERQTVSVVHGAGTARIHTRLVDYIADQFLAQSRFDPLHQAGTEQLLHNQIATWLPLLHERREIRVHIDYRGSHFEARIVREDVVRALEPLYGEIRAFLDPSAGHLIGSRLALLPGFAFGAGFAAELPESAVFEGCATLAALAAAPRAGLSLLTRLPASAAPSLLAPETGATHGVERSVTHGDAITHILCGARAFPLAERPLYLGGNASAGASADGHTVARVDRTGAAVTVTPQNAARVRVNDLTIDDATAVAAGDAITVEGTAAVFLPINVLT